MKAGGIMGIYVKDLLDYVDFQTAEIIAGVSGLSNQIKRINFLGVTTEELNAMAEVDVDELVSEGDFYLALGIFFQRQNVDFYKEFQALLKQSSAGLCIIGYSGNAIDNNIKNLCNSHAYPVISLSQNVPFSNLIDVLMNALIQSRLDQQFSGIINRILYTECSSDLIEEYLREIEPSLTNHVVALHIQAHSSSPLNKLRERLLTISKQLVVLNYRGTLFVFIYASTSKTTFFKKMVHEIAQTISHYRTDLYIGVSPQYTNLSGLKEGMRAAMYSSAHGQMHNNGLSYYEALTIDNWLYEFGDSKTLENYVNRILKPIQKYESEQEIELLETLEYFVLYEGNYKKIAEKLHLHENTVRHRLDKVKELTGLSHKRVSFYTTINLVLRYLKVREIIQGLEEKANYMVKEIK